MKEFLDNNQKCPFLGITKDDIEKQEDISIVANWISEIETKKALIKVKIKEMNAEIFAKRGYRIIKSYTV